MVNHWEYHLGTLFATGWHVQSWIRISVSGGHRGGYGGANHVYKEWMLHCGDYGCKIAMLADVGPDVIRTNLAAFTATDTTYGGGGSLNPAIPLSLVASPYQCGAPPTYVVHVSWGHHGSHGSFTPLSQFVKYHVGHSDPEIGTGGGPSVPYP
jgi:hypothetical protein